MNKLYVKCHVEVNNMKGLTMVSPDGFFSTGKPVDFLGNTSSTGRTMWITHVRDTGDNSRPVECYRVDTVGYLIQQSKDNPDFEFGLFPMSVHGTDVARGEYSPSLYKGQELLEILTHWQAYRQDGGTPPSDQTLLERAVSRLTSPWMECSWDGSPKHVTPSEWRRFRSQSGIVRIEYGGIEAAIFEKDNTEIRYCPLSGTVIDPYAEDANGFDVIIE